jgi:hypothetical protein
MDALPGREHVVETLEALGRDHAHAAARSRRSAFGVGQKIGG